MDEFTYINETKNRVVEGFGPGSRSEEALKTLENLKELDLLFIGLKADLS